MAVLARAESVSGVIQVHHSQSREPERVVEVAHDSVVILDDVVTRGVNVTGVHTDADTTAHLRGSPIDYVSQFLERRAQCGPATSGGFKQQQRLAGRCGEAGTYRIRIARNARLAVIHVVARVGDQIVKPQRGAATQLRGEGL